jgi:hypothetical protein
MVSSGAECGNDARDPEAALNHELNIGFVHDEPCYRSRSDGGISGDKF